MAPSNPPPQTIKALKQDFLNAQTRLLSQPPAPSQAWRRAHDNGGSNENENEADGAMNPQQQQQKLSEKAIDDALFRLNHTLQQHAKRVYPPQATRHVAEQIEQLYLDAGELRMQAERGDGGSRNGEEDGDGVGLDVEGGNAWRAQGADYVQPEIIAALPPTWDSPAEASANPLEAKRYAELVAHLKGLSTRHRDAEARVRRLRQMTAVLEPFKSSTEQTYSDYGNSSAQNIQRNLVTRDGQVEKELERMRMLLARVGDKVARLQQQQQQQGDDQEDAMLVDDVEVDERRKVDNLLSGLA
ncbi:kinetochore Sim4 complex subunit Fta4 [Coniella lustricola]|uniref:Kinetochore Sim4 complex subunit Fta4 n=1 Tax=Coniella lustricola TaxID=2025994 RepID=A0A2T3AG32_9PEZI|nr:kinetochore Sim4 complex subunit Fta4 [Coniella lustricola]